MKNLEQTTFIIPLLIENQDRYSNANITLRYLNKHLKTNVIIYEVSKDGVSRLDFLKELPNLNIQHSIQVCEESFHRTKYLNIMLDQVKTPVVVNYDIDVLLEPETYALSQELILARTAKMLFPYGFGNFQKRIEQNCNKGYFLRTLDLSTIDKQFLIPAPSQFGHCFFIGTDLYRKVGGENENFISWGPEDKERPVRMETLGYGPSWISTSYVYHLEHGRGVDSGNLNPHLKHNEELFQKILKMNKPELQEYYRNQEYLNQYENITAQ